MHMHACIHTHSHTCTLTFIHMYDTLTRVLSHTYTCSHTHTHTCSHSYTCMYTLTQVLAHTYPDSHIHDCILDDYMFLPPLRSQLWETAGGCWRQRTCLCLGLALLLPLPCISQSRLLCKLNMVWENCLFVKPSENSPWRIKGIVLPCLPNKNFDS